MWFCIWWLSSKTGNGPTPWRFECYIYGLKAFILFLFGVFHTSNVPVPFAIQKSKE